MATRRIHAPPKAKTTTAKAPSGRANQRGKDRRDQVRSAAIRIFEEKGYASTSIEDIANAVGLLKGSLYYYIDTKEDLLYDIVMEVHEDVERMLADASCRSDLPPLERLALYVREQAKYNALNVKKIAVYHHDFERLTGERLSEVRRNRRKDEEIVTEVLRYAQDRGDIHADTSPELATKFVFAAVIWIYTWYRSGSVSPQILADYCSSFVINGVAGPPLQQLRRP